MECRLKIEYNFLVGVVDYGNHIIKRLMPGFLTGSEKSYVDAGVSFNICFYGKMLKMRKTQERHHSLSLFHVTCINLHQFDLFVGN